MSIWKTKIKYFPTNIWHVRLKKSKIKTAATVLDNISLIITVKYAFIINDCESPNAINVPMFCFTLSIWLLIRKYINITRHMAPISIMLKIAEIANLLTKAKFSLSSTSEISRGIA